MLTCLQFFDSLFKATEELISDKKALPTSDYFRMDEGRSLHKNNNFWFLKLTTCFYESYCTTRKEQARLLPIAKGQLISKCLFGVFNFFQKTNKNTSHRSKNELIHSSLGRIHGLTICFQN